MFFDILESVQYNKHKLLDDHPKYIAEKFVFNDKKKVYKINS